MKAEEIYSSYLIRIWRNDLKNGRPTTLSWHVEVRHIQSGESWHMDDRQHLMTFLINLIEENESTAF
ncbi:MAG: hypothetical protein R3293_23920 [Candidatus Promineifilaceae bacterium]|nr:hypothetical protein [Candidatus Promineifilaceae bacterium]